MKTNYQYLSLSLLFLLWGGCAVDQPSKSEIAIETREDLSAGVGKRDAGRDWCTDFGWYGDGVCDWFCTAPDPDCACDDGSEVTCDETREERHGACGVEEVAAIVDGCYACVPSSECVVMEADLCDDGSVVTCDESREERAAECMDGEIAAAIDGCFVCVSVDTCMPSAHSCDDGSTVSCDETRDERQRACTDGQVAAVAEGCFRCVDPELCSPTAP